MLRQCCTRRPRDTLLAAVWCGFRKPVDVGSLLRFKSHVVDVTYKQQQQQQQGAMEAHIAVEVAAVISQPEQREITHTNTFRCGQ